MPSAVAITNVRTSQTLETAIDLETLLAQDSGSREAAEYRFTLWDEALAFDLLPEDEITGAAVGAPSDILFGGLVRMLDTDVTTLGRTYRVTAYDYSTLLDRINVVQDERPAGESDADRLAYFMTTYGSGLLDDDPTGIATLNASMPAQKFRLLTLRQAIEQVLGSALETGTYRLNAYKKLDTWDSGPGLSAAPFDVVLATPGAGEIAPEAISIKSDTSELYNAYWVRGATAAGSGWFTDAASIAQWGRREKYVDAPDSDLSWKAFNVGMAALADTKQPKYRGTMTLAEGDWRSEQRFALTSVPHGFTAEPFDTARVGRRYLTPAGLEVFDVEFGSPKASFAAKHGKEARRSDGVGPGSGGWGPGGGDGGVGTGDTDDDCGCGVFIGVDDCDPDEVFLGAGTTHVVAADGQVTLGPGTVDLDGFRGIRLQFSFTTPAAGTSTDVAIEATGGGTASAQIALSAGLGYGTLTVSSSPGIPNTDTSTPVAGVPYNLILNGNGNAWDASFQDLIGTVIANCGIIGTAIPTATNLALILQAEDCTFTWSIFGRQCVPTPGQAVAPRLIGAGDGVTTAYNFGSPYRPGSLKVYVGGTREIQIVEIDPTTGDFELNSPAYRPELIYAEADAG